MKIIKIVSCCYLLSLWVAIPSLALATEIGFAYGREFRDNMDLAQHELFIRESLPLQWEFAYDFKILTRLELGMAMIKEAHSENDEPFRVSIMPQVILNPMKNVHLFFGVGPGFMIGNTKFTNHDLGGSFLLASKIGFQFILGPQWSVGYYFFHQSNGGVYENNASLNMHQLGLSYSF
jgi:hypothetical protein